MENKTTTSHDVGCKNSAGDLQRAGATEDAAWLIKHARIVALELSDRLFSFGMERRPFVKKAALVMDAQANEIERLRRHEEFVNSSPSNQQAMGGYFIIKEETAAHCG